MAPGPKRPRDPNQMAKQLIDIVSGEVEDALSAAKKSPDRHRAGGLKGGAARAKKLTPESRAEIAQKAARSRWTKSKA